MGEKLDKKKTGMIVGAFFAIMHALWALFVAVTPALLQQFLDWMFDLHFLKPVWVLTSFDLVSAILLVALTFAAGYFFGWMFAAIWNWFKKG